ncbi:hypothetical protein pEaSNUABM5_00171 [Erwinia phage pEa_SNUABM_5]|uniref:Uncharacterized protein n=1 Tax=Erwinia phage pEa_SNUABM_5 TaxID=2797313 RepID=A0A7T8EPI7_9CAUD|nr:hypothetical protein MPK73_gp171 [Erwinia phage pEa_SNUABM_5]QQO90313.1 hypothetical protein pEaSNUABM5_00171 [Erwinia phage pEa_SNUABM_5]
MLRQDQVQRLIQQRGLFDEIGTKLGYRHLDWISKDTDNQFSHFPRHAVHYDIPDQPDTYLWADGLAEAIKGGPGYTAYNDSLGDGATGIYLTYQAQLYPNPDTASGWSVVYLVSFVDPNMPLM